MFSYEPGYWSEENKEKPALALGEEYYQTGQKLASEIIYQLVVGWKLLLIQVSSTIGR